MSNTNKTPHIIAGGISIGIMAFFGKCTKVVEQIKPGQAGLGGRMMYQKIQKDQKDQNPWRPPLR